MTVWKRPQCIVYINDWSFLQPVSRQCISRLFVPAARSVRISTQRATVVFPMASSQPFLLIKPQLKVRVVFARVQGVNNGCRQVWQGWFGSSKMLEGSDCIPPAFIMKKQQGDSFGRWHHLIICPCSWKPLHKTHKARWNERHTCATVVNRW